MPIDLQLIVRRANWQANKRTLTASRRIPAPVLDKAREQHGAGLYEAALDTVRSDEAWTSDSQGWRLVGLSYLGMKDHAGSVEAFEQARRLNALEMAKDEVNIATAHMAVHAYDQALAAGYRARELAPELIGSHVCLLSIYNRTERFEDLDRTLVEIITKYSYVLAEPEFLERVTNDTDLVGVADRIAKVTAAGS
jgi:tetratricopeptide (TPR) repeat protein